MSQRKNLFKAVLSSKYQVDISSGRDEKYANYSAKGECSQMFEYGKTVIKCMFHENKGAKLDAGGQLEYFFNRRYDM